MNENLSHQRTGGGLVDDFPSSLPEAKYYGAWMWSSCRGFISVEEQINSKQVNQWLWGSYGSLFYRNWPLLSCLCRRSVESAENTGDTTISWEREQSPPAETTDIVRAKHNWTVFLRLTNHSSSYLCYFCVTCVYNTAANLSIRINWSSVRLSFIHWQSKRLILYARWKWTHYSAYVHNSYTWSADCISVLYKKERVTLPNF